MAEPPAAERTPVVTPFDVTNAFLAAHPEHARWLDVDGRDALFVWLAAGGRLNVNLALVEPDGLV